MARFPWSARGYGPAVTMTRAARAARETLGLTSLRPGQDEAITSLMEGRDVLAVMPTGHGKSAIYQVAGAALAGLTVVVSPLVALQRDQVRAIEEHSSMPGAWALNSTRSTRRLRELWAAVESGAPGFLFLGPEQLAREEVLKRVARLDVRLFVVDEAHCISAWGHDFRPDYLRVGAALGRLGRPPVVALTATASAPVRQEIVDRLGMRNPLVVVRGFNRPEIHLSVRRELTEDAKRAAVVECVASLEGQGVLYVATRKDTDTYATALRGRGMRTAAYHAGLKADERRSTHEKFSSAAVDVVVATNAFGMGIDRPDVRWVVHESVPASPDSYYQEVGRAGRDGEPASAVLFYRPEDFGLHRFHGSAAPDIALLRGILKAVAGAEGPLRPADLRRALGAGQRRVTRAVNLLEQAGALRVVRSGVRMRDGRRSLDEAVERAVGVSEAAERVERSRTEMMRGYAETTGCRRQFLLGYLGEVLDEPCGNCDTCDDGGGTPISTQASAPGERADPFPVDSRVSHREWGDGVVLTTEPDRLTVLFDREGYRVLSLEAVEDENLLTLGV